MTEPAIVLCPGQGAQFVGMGRAWRDRSPEAAAVFAEADGILGDSLGAPLSTLCFEGPEDQLNRTDISQPAIYTCSVACWRGLLASEGVSENDIRLAATAGLSLGEYTALYIAGAMSFEAGLRIVALRGRAMQDAAEAAPSGMVAIIGAEDEAAMAICDQARGADVLVGANFNAPGQVVLSGSLPACDRAAKIAIDKGLRATKLPVAGAFHSPIMRPAADRLAEALAKAEIRAPRCPVYSNVTAQAHTPQPEQIKARLVEQLMAPVRWAAECRNMAGDLSGSGASAGAPAGSWLELAPGKTLSGLMRRIDRSVKVENHDEPKD
ncbi:MAG: ACP S-malonyltransferase [Phycisphaerales bacterium JB039]